MAKAEIIEPEPTPPPMNQVQLTLSWQEAAQLKKLLCDGVWPGHAAPVVFSANTKRGGELLNDIHEALASVSI